MSYCLSSYEFTLPDELIAQRPCQPRDRSRLMVVDRKKGEISEMVFRDLVDFLQKDDSLIFNDTKVIPARLLGAKSSGAAVEMLLTKPVGLNIWEVLAKPGKKLKVGSIVHFSEEFTAEILKTLDDGTKVVRFHCEGDFLTLLDKYGQVPLPHYISRHSSEKEERELYQTIYAANAGAVAAPTAGLHFSDDMFQEFAAKGIEKHMVTLHVGPGTFRPVKVQDIREHQMHSERYYLGEQVASNLNSSSKRRRVCVGTTCCRVLESASNAEGTLCEGDGETDIFIYPGYSFKYVDCLLTNFHLPGSSLMMLVSAFAGRELIQEAYQKAIKDRFRFYSYGDAMLII
ncbi:MAG: S-adenosylmethionine:tRNA ribosyltransferase-isomerase [Chlamydiales bacterium]|jgi:S-adenosylmethionine:tRNA ribosyltransferase-isomerase